MKWWTSFLHCTWLISCSSKSAKDISSTAKWRFALMCITTVEQDSSHSSPTRTTLNSNLLLRRQISQIFSHISSLMKGQVHDMLMTTFFSTGALHPSSSSTNSACASEDTSSDIRLISTSSSKYRLMSPVLRPFGESHGQPNNLHRPFTWKANTHSL